MKSAIVRLLFILTAPTLCVACPSKSEPENQAATATASAAARTPTSAMASASVAPAPPPQPKGPSEPLNVMLLTVDSMRADMPWTTYDKPIAPNLTELARKSVVYPNAYAVASYTAKSVAAMLTSRYPSSLYRSGWFFTGYSESNLFLTEILQKHGVRTMSGHAHMYFARGKNLDQGFDVWELVPGISFDAQTDNHVTSSKVTDLGIKMLSDGQNANKTFFLWMHYMDPHDKYIKHESTPDFGKDNRGRYDSEIHYTDQEIGRLLDFARKQPWWKKTSVIISADHGEAFGEHGMYKHAFELWEVLTRVPLVIYLPDAEPQVIEERRSQIDLGPTILELMGVKEIPDVFVGKTLVPELYGAREPKSHEPIVLDLPEDSHNPPRRAVIQGDYKLTVWGKGHRYQLFNLKQDPGEEKELNKQQPDKLEEMKALFEQTWANIDQVEPFGGMKLKSGRIARGPREPQPAAEEKPTPKEKPAKKAE